MCPSCSPNGRIVERRTFLVAYDVADDVADDRRRDRVAHVLLDFGVRVHYSVSECALSGLRAPSVGAAPRPPDPAEDAVSLLPMAGTTAGAPPRARSAVPDSVRESGSVKREEGV